MVCKVKSRPATHLEPRGRNNSDHGPPALCATQEGVRMEVSAGDRKVPLAEGSAALESPPPPPSQAMSQAVPAENASRVLPRALWKTSAASTADMASDWPCLDTFCGRRESDSPLSSPAWSSFWDLPSRRAGPGGAGPLRVLLVLPGRTGQLPPLLGSTRGQGPTRTGTDWVLRL